MQTFLVLCFVVSLAYGAPQYNYGDSGSSGATFGGTPAASGNFGVASPAGNTGFIDSSPSSYNGGLSASTPTGGSDFTGLGSNGFVNSGSSGSLGGLINSAPSTSSGPALVNKQFYIHSAPEEAFVEPTSTNQNSLNRSLRVVIVKAPDNRALENAALQLSKSASDQQTAIYILSKQPDINDLQSKLSQIQETTANKPEVHFVKYKTPEEAQYAQQAIQSQYDALPGPSQVSDEGVASVEDFAGIGGGAPTGGSVGSVVGGGSDGAGSDIGGGVSRGTGSDSGAATSAFGNVSNKYLPAQRIK